MLCHPHIAILIDTSTTWGRRLIRGIAQYANDHGPWLIHVEPRGRYEQLTVPDQWDVQGVIARVTRIELAEELHNHDIPVVNVSWSHFPQFSFSRCTTSEAETANMAVQYFHDNGFRRFAYCGALSRLDRQDGLMQSVLQAVEKAGCQCDICPAPSGGRGTLENDASSLTQWLESLPKPIAVLTWSAARGRQVTESCQVASIRVPDEIAVLACEGDELMAEISAPPLSTIEQAGKQIGYSAAVLLDQLMQGAEPPTEETLFSPASIRTRQSTDFFAIDDEWVVMALRHIRDHAHEGIRVEDILAEVPLSRRALEQRLTQWIGRTPAAEIRRVRIEKAKLLLVESDLSTAQIARAAGFGQQQVLSRTFRREVGLSPTEYQRMYGR